MPQPRAIVPDSGGVRPGYNATGVTIPNRRLVKKTTTAVDGVTPAVDATAVCYGVTMMAILNGYAGDVQVEGRAIVEAGAAVNIGDKITGGAGGKAAVAGAAAYILGQAASSALVDGDLIEVDIIRQTSIA